MDMTDKRLLIIDDEPEMAEVVRLIGVDLNFETMVTADAVAFMLACEEFKPTVIVLDIVMPEIDGIELLRWLAEQKTTARVIVASAFYPEYAKMSVAIGTARGLAVSKLNKPFELSTLREALIEAARDE